MANGVISHTIESEYQRGPNRLDVLLPGELAPEKRYPVLYVLPVAAGPEEQSATWGTGLEAVRREELARKYGLICVFPVFDTIPWYGDRRNDPRIRQESYLLKVVLPFIETRYPVLPGPCGRLLLGFSKSGWGAVSLLLRHRDLFSRAAAWDAPLMLEAPGPWGSGEVFADQANFNPYCIPRLLAAKAEQFRDEKRLILLGYDNFREHLQGAHTLLEQLGIPHVYHDGPWRQHHWDSGWVEEAIRLLMH